MGTSLRGGIGWNLISVVFIGCAGLFINLCIGRVYGAEELGVFNQVLSLYLVFSQLSVGGFMFSTLSLCGEHREGREEVSRIVSAG
ncbi:MAG: hypothetical protein KDD60_08925, partial [Bdellovibrionales bacterium]|nr:hypothetical protein [Bdellovibrionales bacterium]